MSGASATPVDCPQNYKYAVVYYVMLTALQEDKEEDAIN
jgi:hypothetical protein